MADIINLDLDAWRSRINASGLSIVQRMDILIGQHKEASSAIDAIKDYQSDGKVVLSELLVEHGDMEFKSDTGSCYISSPSVSIRYDAKALDALCASNQALREVLWPHRKVSERAGSLTIR